MAIKISGSTIIDDSRNIVSAGVVTSTSFYGNGANITGISTLNIVNYGVGLGGGGGGGGGSSVGTGITLGTPTDGSLSGAITLSDTTSVTDAIDGLNTLLNKLVPTLPPNLDATGNRINLISQTLYSAIESSTGLTRNIVYSGTTAGSFNGTVVNSSNLAIATIFYDGDSGTLTAQIDSVGVGTTTLTTASDVRISDQLNVLTDVDPYAGISGRADFYKVLTARIDPLSVPSAGIHTYTMTHSSTGTATTTFYRDDVGTPTVTVVTGAGSSSYTTVATGTTHISGVPSVAAGATFSIRYQTNNAIQTFYRSSGISQVSGTVLQATVSQTALGGAIQTKGVGIGTTASLQFSTGTGASGKYAEKPSLTITPYKSDSTTGTTATYTLDSRIDTVSTENSGNTARKRAGSGQYPASGYGGAFDPTQSLLNAGYTEELQLLNGLYRRITGNYTGNLPTAGPNYSSDSQSDYRYFLYQYTSTITSTSSFTLTIQSPTGFTADGNNITANIRIQARVDGATPTSGWIDCNAPFTPGTSPTNNGDAAMVSGESTSSTKRITFGLTQRTGTLYIRIGLPSGDSKTFAGVSIGSIV